MEGDTEFPCALCSANFVTKMSLIRHMILHEDDGGHAVHPEGEEEGTVDGGGGEEKEELSSDNNNDLEIPQQNLLERILTNGNSAQAQNKGNKPIPNLKPLPSLIQLDNNVEKNFQCHLCGCAFRKKEDLSRHVTRTHGGARFTCPYCERNISRRDHLKRHIKNVHPEFCTATEVGPFAAHQGAGRPPKETRANGTKGPPAKRAKVSAATPETTPANCDEPVVAPQPQIMDQTNTTLAFINQLIQAQNNSDYNNFLNVYDENSEEEEEERNGEDNENEEENFQDINKPDFNNFMEYENMEDENGFVEEEKEGGVEEEGEEMPLLEPAQDEAKPSSDSRKFKCELCDAAFMSKINMLRHMDTHSLTRSHVCGVCGKGFLRKEHLTKHLSSVHSGLKYQCQFCQKQISRKDHLLRHIRNCHPMEFMGMPPEMINSEPQVAQVPAVTLSDNPNMRVAALACDLCSEIFNHIDELLEHQSVSHSDIRKFKCPSCPKSFKRKEHLLKHQGTHLPSRKPANSYSCNECSKTFPTFEIASTHVKHAHGKPGTSSSNNNNNTNGASSLPCNLCENTFQDKSLLLQHLKAYHGVSNPENRFMDGDSQSPRQVPIINKIKVKPSSANSRASLPSFGKAQLTPSNYNNNNVSKQNGSLGSLVGLINRGSISLSRVKSEGK